MVAVALGGMATGNFGVAIGHHVATPSATATATCYAPVCLEPSPGLAPPHWKEAGAGVGSALPLHPEPDPQQRFALHRGKHPAGTFCTPCCSSSWFRITLTLPLLRHHL